MLCLALPLIHVSIAANPTSMGKAYPIFEDIEMHVDSLLVTFGSRTLSRTNFWAQGPRMVSLLDSYVGTLYK